VKSAFKNLDELRDDLAEEYMCLEKIVESYSDCEHDGFVAGWNALKAELAKQNPTDAQVVWVGWPDAETPEIVSDINPEEPRGAVRFVEYGAYQALQLKMRELEPKVERIEGREHFHIQTQSDLIDRAAKFAKENRQLRQRNEDYAAGNAAQSKVVMELHEQNKILREGLEILKVAVNDKQQDLGATNFIANLLAKADAVGG
jgi:hypothetical protein